MSRRNHESDHIVDEQAAAEVLISQFQAEARRLRRAEVRRFLGFAVILAFPAIFYGSQVIYFVVGMRAANEFSERASALGAELHFSGGDGMGAIQGAKGAATIRIRRKEFSDDDMATLAPLLLEAENLRGLYLSQSSITDEGLHQLPSELKIRTLCLIETKVTEAGINELLKRAPNLRNCEIRLGKFEDHQ